jgi:4-carboxymuconolactone decarboxylase
MLIGSKDPENMTTEQRRVYDAIASGPRRSVPAPFLGMLDAPRLADAIQAVGIAIRFSGAAPDALREIAILATAAAFGSGYEWSHHEAIARSLGVPQPHIEATRLGATDKVEDEATRLVIVLCRAAVLEKKIRQGELARLVGLVGRAVASEVVAIAGYYPMLALFLSAANLDHALDQQA